MLFSKTTDTVRICCTVLYGAVLYRNYRVTREEGGLSVVQCTVLYNAVQ